MPGATASFGPGKILQQYGIFFLYIAWNFILCIPASSAGLRIAPGIVIDVEVRGGSIAGATMGEVFFFGRKAKQAGKRSK